jgi:PadR family transcriptional regulator PadR
MTFLDNWATQVRKGLLEFCVLRVLARRPHYGYEIVKQLGRVQGFVISEGTVYPLLSRLKREELVDTRLEESPEGPARKYYRLTARGKQQLKLMDQVWSEIVGSVAELRREGA